ncbi:MAG: MaoC family dehydratase [Dehalococcoidia bacterium]|nr:MAG: MaoC family dehydratase [Dehalococcoidia bacterium]
MTESLPTIGGLKDKIGVEWPLGVYEIEKGMIRRFVQAIEDPNPLWQDEEYAARSQYGGIVAPPTFIMTIGFEQIQKLLAASSGTLLHGSTELECYQPLRAGNVITATAKVANIRERPGKMGKMTFITFGISYQNQRQELVAKCRQMVISY